MKTLPKISQVIGVPIATLRYRIKPYEDFIPFVTTSKGKEYSDESDGIIREINELVVQDNSTETILSILSSKYARDIEIIQEATTAEISQQQFFLEQITRQNENIERLIEAMNGQQELQRQLNELRSEVVQLSRMDRHSKKWWEVWK